MVQQIALQLLPEDAYEPMRLQVKISAALNIDVNRIRKMQIRKRSIDARHRRVMVNLTVDVHIDAVDKAATISTPVHYGDVSGRPQVVIVGAGPGGLFAALRLIELGLRPVVLERGKDVDSRLRDLAALNREGRVDPNSNYCFGEGGAGAYSDGKLYTRSKKRGSVEKILNVFHQHGAPEDILIDAHPHIGTDRLPSVIKAMRQTIIAGSGEVHFSTRVTELVYDAATGVVSGVRTDGGVEYSGPVILATGHSARDVYEMLSSAGIALEPKGIAVGVRLEHPQALIDKIQYHSPEGRGRYLPAAEYSMLTRVDGRAVYSFCMCPGGFVIPAASAPGQLVVNGMSPSNRGTKWANSGMVVEILPEDVDDDAEPRELKMMRYQQSIEQRFFAASGDTQQAPAQRMLDFVKGKASATLPRSSYAPGLISARLDTLLPQGVAHRLQQGFAVFGRQARGFLTNDAVLIGDETRTSSPVRIPRDSVTLSHVAVKGLYPCGEGAGYAGGIVSAAIDGERCAEAVARYLGAEDAV